MIELNKKTFLSLIIGLLFSIAALYFTFINIPIKEVTEYIQTINYWWIIPSLFFALLSYVIRVMRWQVILAPVKKTLFWHAFHPLVIGFMINCVFPGRIGEIARPAILYKKENIAFSKVLATVAVERVFDLITMLFFFIITLTFIDIDPTLDITFGGYHLTSSTLNTISKTTLEMSFVIIGLLILVSFSRTRAFISRIILRSPDLLFFTGDQIRQRLKHGICRKIIHVLDNIAVGFEVIKSPWKVIVCLAQSFILWGLVALSLYIFALGCPGINITFLQAFAVEIIICFFIMLPSVPGFWGLWEAGGVFGLMIFGIPAKESAGFTLVYHFLHVVPIVIIGIISAMIIGVNLIQTTRNGEQALQREERMDKCDQ